MVYGYSNSSVAARHLRPRHLRAAGEQQPAGADRHLRLGGADAVRLARDRARPARRSTSRPPAHALRHDFEPWLDVAGPASTCAGRTSPPPGSSPRSRSSSGTAGPRPWARSASLSIAGRRRGPTARRRGLLPAGLRRRQGRLALPGRPLIAWTDDQGLKVAGDAVDHQRLLRAHLAAGRDRGGRRRAPRSAGPTSPRSCRRRRRRRRPSPPPADGPATAPVHAARRPRCRRRSPRSRSTVRPEDHRGRGGQGHGHRDRRQARRSAPAPRPPRPPGGHGQAQADQGRPQARPQGQEGRR